MSGRLEQVIRTSLLAVSDAIRDNFSSDPAAPAVQVVLSLVLETDRGIETVTNGFFMAPAGHASCERPDLTRVVGEAVGSFIQAETGFEEETGVNGIDEVTYEVES